MSLPSDSGSQTRPNGSPARTPASLPSLSLPRLGIVRDITRAPRRSSSGAQSTSDGRAESFSEHKQITNKFPDLVYEILQKARAEPDTPEGLFDGTERVPHVQAEGRTVWEEFQTHATGLEKDLQKFQDAVQELGSSLDLIKAARDMRESIVSLSQLFQENARKLFPKALIPQRLPRMGTGYGGRRPQYWRRDTNARFNANHRVEEKSIFEELKALADGAEHLRLALEQFPEFHGPEVWPLMFFETDLKYWSSTLEHYKDQFESREVRLYVHDLSKELNPQFEDTSLCLRGFIDGVPTVRLSQKHDMSNLQSLATIATFFSAVTATTIQYSYAKNDDGVDNAVNVFWFSSLVFSIASALNSSLVLTWRRANYSSPRLRIPWWLWIWIRQCPTVFLLVSVVTFLAGLGCFTVSSHQAHFTSIIVIISEAISAFGLAALLVWLAYDKWTFLRQSKDDAPMFGISGLRENLDDVLASPYRRTPSWYIPPNLPKVEPDLESAISLVRTTTAQSTALTPEQQAERSRRRWGWAIENVLLVSKAIRAERGREVLESKHMDNLDPRLRKLAMSDELTGLQGDADTNDIQFDPQGKSLAVCGKNLSMRYELESTQTDLFRHYLDKARQVVWASSGDYLMTRTSRAIYVWTLTGDIAPQSIITRNDISHYILSVPNVGVPKPFQLISLEGVRRDRLVFIDLSEKEHIRHDFENISIQHLDITPDGSRILMVTSTVGGTGGIQPVKALVGNKLMVFNIETRQVEHQVPLWYNVQQVTISGNGKWAVVTYKDYPPPQLWRLHRTSNGIQLLLERQFCASERVSAHEFDPSQHIRFVGRGHFVDNDRYVLCVTTDGKVHIWRRDRAHPVHVHGRLTLDKDKAVQIASSRMSSDFMFATRSHNGTVRIWNIQDPPTIQIETPGRSGTANSAGKGISILRSMVVESPQDAQPSGSLVGLGEKRLER